MARILRVREVAKKLALADKLAADARAADLADMAARLDRLAAGYRAGRGDDAAVLIAKSSYAATMSRAIGHNDAAAAAANTAAAAALDRLRDADRARRVAELLRDTANTAAAAARRRRDES